MVLLAAEVLAELQPAQVALVHPVKALMVLMALVVLPVVAAVLVRPALLLFQVVKDTNRLQVEMVSMFHG